MRVLGVFVLALVACSSSASSPGAKDGGADAGGSGGSSAGSGGKGGSGGGPASGGSGGTAGIGGSGGSSGGSGGVSASGGSGGSGGSSGSGSTCDPSTCVSSPPCVDRSCSGDSCVETFHDGASCGGGDPCHDPGTCQGGSCSQGAAKPDNTQTGGGNFCCGGTNIGLNNPIYCGNCGTNCQNAGLPCCCSTVCCNSNPGFC